jgi:phosphoglucosamine mutase
MGTSKKLFGTDGVRGVANREPVTPETAMKLGRAAARFARSTSASRHRILVGKDTRLSGDMLEAALVAGICSEGVDVLLAGTIPTPGVAFLTSSMRCDAGAVISASHNPFQDNGIKFIGRDGFKLTDDQEADIERFVLSEAGPDTGVVEENIGRTGIIRDAVGRYVMFLKNTFPRNISLDGLAMVLDCANGAAHEVAPLVFEELGVGLQAIGIDPDGKNINHGCGSLHPEIMCHAVKSSGAQIGVALDGDADRAIFADERGEVVDGDQIMGLIAWDLMRRGMLAHNTLVATVMSNVGLELAMKELGVRLVRTDVGDRYVVERMRRDGLNFGGEQSGHLVLLDMNTTGDGILSALQVLRVIAETGKPLSELAGRVKRYPQILQNVVVTERKDLDTIPSVRRAMNEATAVLGNSGRLLVRYSGTQLLCRVMAEGERDDDVRHAVDMVADAIRKYV